MQSMFDKVGKKRERPSACKRDKDQPQTKKARMELSCFPWLPAELVHKILHSLPYQLDPVHRMVCRRWKEILKDRFKRTTSLPRSYSRNSHGLIKWIADHNPPSLFEWWLDHSNITCPTSDAHDCSLISIPLVPCVRRGRLDMVQMLLRKRKKHVLDMACSFDCEVLNDALKTRLDLAKLVYKYHKIGGRCIGIDSKAKHVYAAYSGGNQECVDWITEKHKKHSERMWSPNDAMMAAVSGGHLALVQSLYRTYETRPSSRMACRAARKGYLDVVQWLVKYGDWYNVHPHRRIHLNTLLEEAFECGQKAIVDWITSTHPQWYVNAKRLTHRAIKARNYATLALLKAHNKLVLSLNTFTMAVRRDMKNAAMLDYLEQLMTRDLGSVVLREIMCKAIRLGCLDAAAWCVSRMGDPFKFFHHPDHWRTIQESTRSMDPFSDMNELLQRLGWMDGMRPRGS